MNKPLISWFIFSKLLVSTGQIEDAGLVVWVDLERLFVAVKSKLVLLLLIQDCPFVIPIVFVQENLVDLLNFSVFDIVNYSLGMVSVHHLGVLGSLGLACLIVNYFLQTSQCCIKMAVIFIFGILERMLSCLNKA
jgi:hypothetical protein